MRHHGRSTWARVAFVVLAVGFLTSAVLSVGAGPTAGPAEAQGTVELKNERGSALVRSGELGTVKADALPEPSTARRFTTVPS